MTSPNGINWTSRTTSLFQSTSWSSVTYGNNLFVAVTSVSSIFGASFSAVMTSPDGITWTDRNTPVNASWRSVTYGTVNGNSLFVAVAGSGDNSRVMTSPDGITWTSRTPATVSLWYSVTYGNNLFVAVGSGVVMTSPDGITWTSRTTAASNSWRSVTYGDGLFVAVSATGTLNRVMTSGEFGLSARITAAANAEAARVAAANAEAARVAAANAEAARVAAAPAAPTTANAEAERKAREQKELTEILALIPIIGELTLSLGEFTKIIITKESVVSGVTKKQPIKVTASELKQIQKLGKKLALRIAASNKGSVNEGAVASFAEGVRILYGK
jgi:hypothetical protein